MNGKRVQTQPNIIINCVQTQKQSLTRLHACSKSFQNAYRRVSVVERIQMRLFKFFNRMQTPIYQELHLDALETIFDRGQTHSCLKLVYTQKHKFF